MGCCLKKKTNLLLNEDLYDYEVDDFILYSKEELLIFEESKARRLVKLMLSNDKYLYSKFLDKVLSFDKNDFQKLFEGDDEYIFSNINYYEKNDFNLLLMKFDNYQYILQEWYRDESKHKYLNILWNNYVNMGSFKNKNSYEINNEIQKIMNFTNNEYHIKEKLIELIQNSPESKADELKNFIKEKRPDFYELIDTASTYQKKIEQSDLDNKDTLIDNLKFIAEKGICSVPQIFKDFIEKNGGYKNVSKSLMKKLQKELLKSFKSQAGMDNYGFGKISTLSKVFKNFLNLSEYISKYYSNTSLCLANLGLSFLNLCTSIIDFYKCFENFNEKKNEYSNRLKKIHDDFITHKGEIVKFTNLKNTEEYIKNIIEIGNKISQDKQNILRLISEIEQTIKEVEKKKAKSILGIVAASFGFVFSVVGAVFTGKITSVVYGVAALFNAFDIALNSGNIVQIKKQIKEYKSILENANNEYEYIEREIKTLAKMCNLRYDEYLPKGLV